MELKDKKPKISFGEFVTSKEKRDFDPMEIIEQKDEAMPIPEMMKQDYKKMELLNRRKWKE